jgi:hypothetical protein
VIHDQLRESEGIPLVSPRLVSQVIHEHGEKSELH